MKGDWCLTTWGARANKLLKKGKVPLDSKFACETNQVKRQLNAQKRNNNIQLPLSVCTGTRGSLHSVQPQYSQVLYIQICLLTKIYSFTGWAFSYWRTHAESQKLRIPGVHVPSWGQTRPSCFSPQTVKKHPSCRLLSAMFTGFFVPFVWWFHCSKWLPSHFKCFLVFLKHKKVVTCHTEKICLLSGMSYSIVDHEFNVNVSTGYIKSLNRNVLMVMVK